MKSFVNGLVVLVILALFSGCATVDGAKHDSKKGWENTKEVSQETWDKTKEVSKDAWEATKETSKKVYDSGKEALQPKTNE